MYRKLELVKRNTVLAGGANGGRFQMKHYQHRVNQIRLQMYSQQQGANAKRMYKRG